MQLPAWLKREITLPTFGRWRESKRKLGDKIQGQYDYIIRELHNIIERQNALIEKLSQQIENSVQGNLSDWPQTEVRTNPIPGVQFKSEIRGAIQQAEYEKYKNAQSTIKPPTG